MSARVLSSERFGFKLISQTQKGITPDLGLHQRNRRKRTRKPEGNEGRSQTELRHQHFVEEVQARAER